MSQHNQTRFTHCTVTFSEDTCSSEIKVKFNSNFPSINVYIKKIKIKINAHAAPFLSETLCDTQSSQCTHSRLVELKLDKTIF
jgi:hypothetical protein